MFTPLFYDYSEGRRMFIEPVHRFFNELLPKASLTEHYLSQDGDSGWLEYRVDGDRITLSFGQDKQGLGLFLRVNDQINAMFFSLDREAVKAHLKRGVPPKEDEPHEEYYCNAIVECLNEAYKELLDSCDLVNNLRSFR